ncbi:MAG: oligopeptide/dipeptide ABC transporter ATP-binding protein [Candidatus Hodarchaeota archaeon]
MPGAPPNLIDPPSGCRFHPRCESSKRICAQEEPNLIEIRPGHNVKCRLYE